MIRHYLCKTLPQKQSEANLLKGDWINMYQPRQFPVSESEFEKLFPNESACIDYLYHTRWPSGFYCPSCMNNDDGVDPARIITCAYCGEQTSLTTGTIMDGTDMPLHDWLLALWWLSMKDGGTSDIPGRLHLGSYQTVRGWLHQLRVVMALADEDPCCGVVEVGSRFVAPVRRALRPVQVLAAAERLFPSGNIGRIHIQVIDTLKAEHVKSFVHQFLEEGCTIVGPKLSDYADAADYGSVYVLDSGSECPVGIHEIMSKFEVWLKNMHREGLEIHSLQQYCDEFCFQHNALIHADSQTVFSSLLEGCFAGLTKPAPEFAGT